MGGEWQLDLSDLFLVRVFSRKKLCPILCPPCDSDEWAVARRPIEMQHYVENRKDPCRGKSCCFSKPI